MEIDNLASFFITFAVSAAFTLLVLRTSRYHGHLSHDGLIGIQKYHSNPTPRVGGLAIFLSFTIVLLMGRLFDKYDSYSQGVVGSGFSVFFIGILEDITKKISPLVRMIFFVLSTYLAIYVTHSMPVIFSTDFVGLDNLIHHHQIIGMLLSLFAVVGLTNAYNVIDGYNGLSATTSIINFIGFCGLAFFLSDMVVMSTVIYIIAAILGFWAFNYPKGKIFLGDGGAYLLGFVMAVTSVFLVENHPGSISPYAVLLLNIYPVTEIGFSIYRRKFMRNGKAMMCDNFHLHQLIYHRCIPSTSENRNARVLPLMLYFIVPQVILTLIFYKSTLACLFFILLYIVFYVSSYFCLLKFKTFCFLKVMLKKAI